MSNSTDSLTAVTVNDRATVAQEPTKNNVDRGQLLLDRSSTELVNSMKTSDPSSSSKYLNDLGFSNGEAPKAPRDIAGEDPARHARKTTPEEFKKELDQLKLSPEANEIAHDLVDAFAKGPELKAIVDALSEFVKEHSKDPGAMKEAVGAFSRVLRKYGISEPMSVTDDGALVFGGGSITIEPDGKVVVKPVRKPAQKAA